MFLPDLVNNNEKIENGNDEKKMPNIKVVHFGVV
jgi:hypothetical protein